VINHSSERLDSVEIAPFRQAISEGIDGIMVAHLSIPALEKDPERPSSLSENIIKKTLREGFGFNGCHIYRCAEYAWELPMPFLPESSNWRHLKLVCDILLMPVNVPAVLDAFKTAMASGEITEKMIDEKVERILFTKYKAGLHQVKYPDTTALVFKLNANVETLSRGIYERAVTLVNNRDSLLPFHLIDTTRFASLVLNAGEGAERISILITMPALIIFTLTKIHPVRMNTSRPFRLSGIMVRWSCPSTD
jgi:beta-N-acetylhexosaminidase